MTTLKCASRFLITIAASVVLLAAAPVVRARAADLDELRTAAQTYCGLERIFDAIHKHAQEEARKCLEASYECMFLYNDMYSSEDVYFEAHNACVTARNAFNTAYIADVTNMVTTVLEPEKPERVAKPQPKPKPTRTVRRPRPSDEEAPPPQEAAPSHDPTASTLLGIAAGAALGAAIGTRHGGGGGGGGGGRPPSGGGGGCPGGKCK